MIIDFHTHTFPDSIAAHALSHMQSLSHNTFYSDGTAAGLIASQANAGIDLSVVLPVVTNPLKASHINDISIAHDPKDGLLYFGGIHPDTADWHEELARIARSGIKGIKLHPHYQDTDIDDIRYLRILDRCAELGLIVVIHAGKDPAFPGQNRCNPKMIRNALKQVGPVTLVAAHMGGLWNWDMVADNLADLNIYIDTSNTLGTMEQTDEHYYQDSELVLLDNERFCKLVRDFGAHRVLFGSDSPWTCQKTTVKKIHALPLSQNEKDHIFFENAYHLLHMDTK